MKKNIFAGLLACFALSCASSQPSEMKLEDCVGPDVQKVLTFCASPDAALQATKNVESKKAFASGDDSFNPIPVGDSHTIGPATAPVTIVMFTDLQCGFCARAHSELKAVQAANPEDVRLVFKNMPLPFHEQAVPAALAAMAAGKQGKFWEFVELAYDKQTELAPDFIKAHAAGLGLDMEQFQADFGNEADIEKVQADLNLGVKLGVNGTPTMFINGVRAVGVQTQDELQRLVAQQKAFVDVMRNAGVDHEDIYWRMVAVNYEAPEELPEPEPEEEILEEARYVPVGTSPVKGPIDAPVTIVVFSEFQCPFCSRILPVFEEIHAKYPDKVRFVYKHFPLDFHPQAMPAALASMAAQDAGKFWEYHDILFANQDALDNAKLAEYGAEVGVDAAAIEAALSNEAYQARVIEDLKLAQVVGVNGTPTSFVNGIIVRGAVPDGWTELIDSQIELAESIKDRGLSGEDLYQALVELNNAE
ncbi:thioredoxin [Microvenator marinus]|uniref:Thioredoxin n=1 Tax=Microvenator marinus TaxID=2600177 RepID=A0A5B8XWU6_9DELT|nr:thioredoxin domain-containing protein [Microvenator marinus]QED27949.1 thioredoxin [Microvenator marinus]